MIRRTLFASPELKKEMQNACVTAKPVITIGVAGE